MTIKALFFMLLALACRSSAFRLPASRRAVVSGAIAAAIPFAFNSKVPPATAEESTGMRTTPLLDALKINGVVVGGYRDTELSPAERKRRAKEWQMIASLILK